MSSPSDRFEPLERWPAGAAVASATARGRADDVVETRTRRGTAGASSRPPNLPVVSIEYVGARRQELTRQAARLFAEKGYHGTSVGDLAEALGVRKGSLYSRLDAKGDLLCEAMPEGAAAFQAGLDSLPEGAATLVDGSRGYTSS